MVNRRITHFGMYYKQTNREGKKKTKQKKSKEKPVTY